MRAVKLLVWAAMLTFASSGIAQQTTPNKPKVYTEDDLKQLNGGISVIGETPAKPKPGDKADEDSKPGMPKTKSKIPDKSEACADWAVAAAVSSALGSQGVPFDASYWVDRIYGGTRCPKSIGGLSSIAGSIDGDYALDDASKVRVRTKVGAPSSGSMVEDVKANRPMVIIWQGVPYVSQSVRYVKEVYSDGSILYKIKEIELSNSYLDKRVTFRADRDRESDLEAMQFSVSSRQ